MNDIDKLYDIHSQLTVAASWVITAIAHRDRDGKNSDALETAYGITEGASEKIKNLLWDWNERE